MAFGLPENYLVFYQSKLLKKNIMPPYNQNYQLNTLKRSAKMTNLLITGAGVDRTTGIDFPLANTLLADLARYLENKGKEVDLTLRRMLPNLRFNFNSIIKNAVDKIAVREPHEQREMVQRVQDAIANLPENDIGRKHGELIVRLFDKLATIAEESQLDDETEQLIREVFPQEADDFLDSDSILDIHKLSLSDTFKAVLKRTLKMGLTGRDRDHAVANALGAELLNIETLLVQTFLGFYSNKLTDIKNYLYISWSLWAFLVEKQKQVFNAHPDGNLPFYSNLPDNIRAITLNYTSFLQNQLGNNNVICFHGGLDEYVRMDTRNLMSIENILECSPQKFISDTVKFDVSDNDIKRHRHVIPAFVPPLRIKPVLSNKYIDLWAEASKLVREAEHIVVVGYSFNSADEHFNDILRQHPNRRIDIVVPNAERDDFKERIEKVFNKPQDQFDNITVQGKSALQCQNLRLISAKADEIEIAELFQ